MLTMEEIENISFRRSGLGGYKVEDVDTFVDGVIEKVMQEEENSFLKTLDSGIASKHRRLKDAPYSQS